MTIWNRSNWASLAPNGIGHVKPNHYLEMAKVVWRNRDQLPFAWRILTQGVCDGCALGTAGVRDFTMDGVHLCMVRLELMRLNTSPALEVKRLADARALARMTAAELRVFGRLPYPMMRRRGEKGFARITWDEALKIAAARAVATQPQRMAFYLTSRGLTNEAYYVAQKVARFFGTNNVDNSARICHASSTDAFFQVHTGGDRAFIAGVIKHLIEQGWANDQFIEQYTSGFDELKAKLGGYSWNLLEAASGASRDEMLRFARMLGEARTAVFVWSMGITQHCDGVANVRAIVSLALARGFIGQPKSGLMPIRGHSGVQGGAEVGCVPNQFPGGVMVNEEGASRMGAVWGFDVPAQRGLNVVEMIEAAHDGRIDWFYISGGNFLETLPEPDFVREAIERVPARIHQDIVLSPQMFVDPNDVVLLLPARTRYEQRGGGTETTTERRILFSPEIPGRRIGEAKAEWEIPMLIAEIAKPASAHLIHFDDAQAIRNEIARAAPAYEGIQNLRTTGDQVQWGGERLCEARDANGRITPKFATPDGRAGFSVIEIDSPANDSKLRLSTRRGKQFNSIVHRDRDPLNGARRDDVLMNEEDARRRGLADGDAIVVRSEVGALRGHCRIAPIAAGTVQIHWPEGNALIKRGVRDPECGIPDYNATVEIERVN